MKYPTVKQLGRMIWGFRLVGVDLHTRGTAGPLPVPARRLGQADGPIIDANTNGCPGGTGRRAVRRSHRTRAPSPAGRPRPSAMLIIGYLPDDVLGQEAEGSKVRVQRLWVEPDPVDPVQLVLWDITSGQKGERADLSGRTSPGRTSPGRPEGEPLRGGPLPGRTSPSNLSGANLSRGGPLGRTSRGEPLRANLSGRTSPEPDLSGATSRGEPLAGGPLTGRTSAGRTSPGRRTSAGRGPLRANLSRGVRHRVDPLPAGWTVNASGLVVGTRRRGSPTAPRRRIRGGCVVRGRRPAARRPVRCGGVGGACWPVGPFAAPPRLTPAPRHVPIRGGTTVTTIAGGWAGALVSPRLRRLPGPLPRVRDPGVRRWTAHDAGPPTTASSGSPAPSTAGRCR